MSKALKRARSLRLVPLPRFRAGDTAYVDFCGALEEVFVISDATEASDSTVWYNVRSVHYRLAMESVLLTRAEATARRLAGVSR